MFAVNFHLELVHCPANLWTNADFSPPKLRTNKDFVPSNHATFILFPAKSECLHTLFENQCYFNQWDNFLRKKYFVSQYH